MTTIVTVDSVASEYKARFLHMLSECASLLPTHHTPLEISLACLEATSRPPGIYVVQPGLADVDEEFSSLERRTCDAIRAVKPWSHVAVVIGTDPDEAFELSFANASDGTIEDARSSWTKLKDFNSVEVPVTPDHVIRGFVHDRSVLGEIPENLARIKAAVLACVKTT